MKSVDEKKSEQSTSAGVSGSKDVQDASDDKAGDSGARIGNKVIRI